VTKQGQPSSHEDAPAEGIPGEDPDDVSTLAGCTHIVWCDAPDPLTEVLCDSNDAPCSCAARRAECISDANFVSATGWTRRFSANLSMNGIGPDRRHGSWASG
jgi:hypothetical protein